MVLRKLAVALLGVGVMLPGLSHALTVGSIDVKSALGEPFRGVVDLSDLGDLSADDIKVSLGSQDDFERMGVDRVYFLQELKFDVVVDPKGHSYINVTSAKPVREPYLDFVIQVNWPAGNFSKELTALLDPPMLGDTSAPPVQQAQATGATANPTPAPAVTPAVPTATAAAPAPEAPVSTASAPAAAPEKPARAPREPRPMPVVSGSYKVRPSDTLWKVAQKVRPTGSVTVAQTMIALQKENPDAFANNNINQLKNGEELQVPTADQIREVSAQEAIASVREQANSWHGGSHKEKLAAEQVNGTSKAESAPPPEKAAPKAEMKLLAPEGGKEAVASAGSTKHKLAPAAAKKVSQNHVKAETAKKENQQLSAKVGTLDNQVKGNDKKLEMQDAKLAQLQAQLKDQQAKAEAAKSAAASKKTEKLAEAAAVPAAAAAAAAAKTPAATPAAAANSAAAADKNAQPADINPNITAKPLAEQKPQHRAVAPQQPTAPADDSFLPDWWPFAAAGVGVLVAGGAGFAFMKRRREKADENAALAELEAMDSHDEHGHDHHEHDEEAFSLPSHEDEHLDLDGDLGNFMGKGSTQEVPMFKDSTPALADPLEEVEQYLAYERYPQAVAFLNKAIAASPKRTDLRLKLLEIYAKLDDHNGFAQQEAELERSSDLSVLSRIEELKGSMSPGKPAAGKGGAMDFAAAKPAHADDDMPSLEELEMDFNASVSASSPNLKAFDDAQHFEAPKAAAPEAADLSHGLDDLDFSFDEPAAKPAAAHQQPAHHEEELSFDHHDLDLDEHTHYPAAEAPKSAPVHEDHDLSFTLDEPALSKPALDKPSFEKSSFDDLSFDEPKSPDTKLSGMSLGNLELADFDSAPELAEPEVKTHAEDLNFSLDDLDHKLDLDEHTHVPAAAAPKAAPLHDDLSLDALHHDSLHHDGLEGDFDLDHPATHGGAAPAPHVAEAPMSGLGDMAAEFDMALADSTVIRGATPAPAPKAPEPVKAAPAAHEAGGLGIDDEFDFLADTDENATKLDLARAYIDMGDKEGAKDILQEVLSEGSNTQKEEAKGLLAQVG